MKKDEGKFEPTHVGCHAGKPDRAQDKASVCRLGSAVGRTGGREWLGCQHSSRPTFSSFLVVCESFFATLVNNEEASKFFFGSRVQRVPDYQKKFWRFKSVLP